METYEQHYPPFNFKTYVPQVREAFCYTQHLKQMIGVREKFDLGFSEGFKPGVEAEQLRDEETTLFSMLDSIKLRAAKFRLYPQTIPSELDPEIEA